jgi:hypothetical protein
MFEMSHLLDFCRSPKLRNGHAGASLGLRFLQKNATIVWLTL